MCEKLDTRNEIRAKDFSSFICAANGMDSRRGYYGDSKKYS